MVVWSDVLEKERMIGRTTAGIILGGGLNPRPPGHNFINKGYFVKSVTPKCVEFSKDPEAAYTLMQFDRELIAAWINNTPMEELGIMASIALVDQLTR